MELYELMNFCNSVIEKLEKNTVALTHTSRTDIPQAAIDRVQEAFTDMLDKLRTFKEAYNYTDTADSARNTLAQETNIRTGGTSTWTGPVKPRFLSGARKVVKRASGGFDVHYDNGTYLITDNLYQQLRDANEEATIKGWHEQRQGRLDAIGVAAARPGKTRTMLSESLVTWREHPGGGAIDATMLNSAPTPINPDNAVAGTWNQDHSEATIELKDGSCVYYTNRAYCARMGDQWDPALNKKLQVNTRPEHPSNFAAMYNYVKFDILPGERSQVCVAPAPSENGDVGADPHEGMVQGYDGEWRWL